MILVAFLVLRVAEDSASGKTDAALGQDLELATRALRGPRRRRAARPAGRSPQTRRSSGRSRAGEDAGLRDVVAKLARREELRGYEFSGAAGLESFGTRGAPESLFAPATITLAGAGGGELTVSTTQPDDYLHAVTRETGEEAAVIADDGTLVGSLEIDAEAVPEAGEAADFDGTGDRPPGRSRRASGRRRRSRRAPGSSPRRRLPRLGPGRSRHCHRFHPRRARRGVARLAHPPEPDRRDARRRRAESAAATSAARSRSSVTTRWPGWRASSTRCATVSPSRSSS